MTIDGFTQENLDTVFHAEAGTVTIDGNEPLSIGFCEKVKSMGFGLDEHSITDEGLHRAVFKRD